jgi:1,4-dihydroxy-2-naphthoate octaprenyltransferase
VSLWLFAAIYYGTYLAVVIMVILRILSPICLLSLISLIPVQKNINTFFREQVKSRTFVMSIKNFILIMGTDTALIFLSGLVR